MTISDIKNEAFLIVNNLAFLILKLNSCNSLGVYDLNDKNNRAMLIYNPSIHRYLILSSTFSEGRRKCEMLCLVEKNTKRIVENI